MNQEIDEQDLGGSVWEDETGEESAQDENNESWANKSKSNFKALYKSNKEKERLLAQKDEELANALQELQQWRELNADTAKDLDKSKDVDSIKEEIFTLKNPEAEPFLKQIREAMNAHNMDYAKAWKFVKMDIPQESVTKKDFNIWNQAPKKAIDLKNLKFEETWDLTKEQRSEWRKLHWYS